MTDEGPATLASLAQYDWLVTNQGEVLHALRAFDDPELAEWDWGGPGRTACGHHSDWLCIPGLFSRMGTRRCKRCCKATGLPRGKGSPKNDDACRRLVGLD